MRGKEQGAILVKPAEMVHSEGRLTAVQRKIFNTLLFNAYPRLRDGEDGTFEIPLTRLREITGITTRDIHWIRGNLEELQTISIDWDLLNEAVTDPKTKRSIVPRGRSVPVPDIALDADGIIRYTLSRWTAQVIRNRRYYAYLDLLLQADLRSRYSAALFECAVRYQPIGHTGMQPITFWRKVLGVEGTRKGVKELNRKVINPAIDEINRKTGLKITPDYDYGPRGKIEGMRLHIDRTGAQATEDPDVEALAHAIHDATGLSPQQACTLIQEHGLDRSARAHKAITAIMRSDPGRIRNKAGWFRSALKEGWTEASSASSTSTDPAPSSASRATAPAQSGTANSQDLAVTEWHAHMRETLAGLSEGEYSALKESFAQQASAPIARLLRRQGPEGIGVRDSFYRFIADQSAASYPQPPAPHHKKGHQSA